MDTKLHPTTRKKLGLFESNKDIPSTTGNNQRKDLPFYTDEQIKAFLLNMMNPEIVSSGPKVVGNPNSYYTF